MTAREHRLATVAMVALALCGLSLSSSASAQSAEEPGRACAVDSCMAVPPELAPRFRADYGITAGAPYDVDGNLVDRHGNIVAVPAAADRPQEVFVLDPPAQVSGSSVRM